MERSARTKGYYKEKMPHYNKPDNGQEQVDQNQFKVPKEKRIKKTAREIAREARQRKKAYIDMLEGKNEEMANQNEALKQKISSLIEQNKILQKYCQKQDQYFHGLVKEFKNLCFSLEKGESTEISRCLSVLRVNVELSKDKYGSSGRQRIKALENMFDRIIGYSLPMHYRMLMEYCLNNHKFYELFARENLRKLATFSEKEKETIIRLRPQIVKHRDNYERILVDLNQVRERMTQVNRQCQKVVDKIQDTLVPEFVGRLLVNLDHYRGREGFDEIFPINKWEEQKHLTPIEMKRVISEDQPRRGNFFEFQNDLEILDSFFN